MKDCKKIHPLLSDYLDGLLSAREKGRVEGHLKDCAEGRKELDQLRRLRETMVALPAPQPPQDLHQRIMARVKGGPLPHVPHRPFWIFPAGAVAVAAMVTVFVMVQNPGVMNLEKTKAFQAPMAVRAATPGGNLAQTYTFGPQKDKDANRNLSVNGAISTDIAVQYAAPLPAEKKTRSLGITRDVDLYVQKPISGEANVPAANLGLSSTTLATGTNFAGQAEEKPSALKAADGLSANYSTSTNTTTYQFGAEEAPVASSNARNFAPAPAAPAVPTPTPLSSWGGSINPAASETQELVSDAATFQKYWQEFQPTQPLPTVDFATQAVVVLMDQERPSAGYSIRVTRLEDKPDQLVVHYQVEGPAPGTVTAQVLTRPWTLQVISKPTKPVVFQKD